MSADKLFNEIKGIIVIRRHHSVCAHLLHYVCVLRTTTIFTITITPPPQVNIFVENLYLPNISHSYSKSTRPELICTFLMMLEAYLAPYSLFQFLCICQCLAHAFASSPLHQRSCSPWSSTSRTLCSSTASSKCIPPHYNYLVLAL